MESVSSEEEARYDPDLNDEKSMLLRPVNSKSGSNLRRSTDRYRQSDCPLGDNGNVRNRQGKNRMLVSNRSCPRDRRMTSA